MGNGDGNRDMGYVFVFVSKPFVRNRMLVSLWLH
jgi:hypothetical protein